MERKSPRELSKVIEALKIALQTERRYRNVIGKLNKLQQKLHRQAPEMRDTHEHYESLRQLLKSNVPYHIPCQDIFNDVVPYESILQIDVFQLPTPKEDLWHDIQHYKGEKMEANKRKQEHLQWETQTRFAATKELISKLNAMDELNTVALEMLENSCHQATIAYQNEQQFKTNKDDDVLECAEAFYQGRPVVCLDEDFDNKILDAWAADYDDPADIMTWKEISIKLDIDYQLGGYKFRDIQKQTLDQDVNVQNAIVEKTKRKFPNLEPYIVDPISFISTIQEWAEETEIDISNCVFWNGASGHVTKKFKFYVNVIK